MRESAFALLTRLSEAQNHRCAYCALELKLTHSRRYRGPDKATIDHVIPISRLGLDEEPNMVAACMQCNHIKGSQHANSFYRKLQKLLATFPKRERWHEISQKHARKLWKHFWPNRILVDSKARNELQVEKAKKDPELGFRLAEKMKRMGKL